MTDNKTEGKNFRRFKPGVTPDDWDLEEKIFKADHSYKCPTYIVKTPPCSASCPSGHDIRGWLAIARGMDKPAKEGQPWQEYAFERMTKANPFPGVMGRVCPAPCQEGCNRNVVDDFVGINALEHYVGDWAAENDVKFTIPSESTGKKVAVIGAGPGGMAMAYFLRKKGHAVTIFDEHEKLGGMMRYGIPTYRVPRDKLDQEIQRILDMGVEVKTNTRVGRDVSVEELERDYDAIYWAIGAQKGRGLPIPGWQGTENCITGVEFLEAFNQGWVYGTAKRIIVVGGGDTSIDVASVARRLGHIAEVKSVDNIDGKISGFTAEDVAGILKREGVKAVLTSLFEIDEMFAAKHERDEAMREGVEIKGGIMPLEVVKDENGRATGLKMCKCTMDGMTPIPVEGTEFVLEGDIIVSAIGQSGDFEGFEDMANERGFMDTDAYFRVSGKEKHFAGGDIIRPHLLTTAIGHARIAADEIDFFLSGEELAKRPKVDVAHFNLLAELNQRGRDLQPYDGTQTLGTSSADWAVHNFEDRSSKDVITHEEMFLGHFTEQPRAIREEIPVDADHVLGNFQERIKPLTEEQARYEGERCMSCGLCFECDNCVIFCPQDAVHRVKKDERAVGRYVFTDYSRCVGCHICSDVCPTGYIKMGLGQ